MDLVLKKVEDVIICFVVNVLMTFVGFVEDHGRNTEHNTTNAQNLRKIGTKNMKKSNFGTHILKPKIWALND